MRTLWCPLQLDVVSDVDWQKTLVETSANWLLVGIFTAQNFERWWDIHFLDHSLTVLFLLLIKHLFGHNKPLIFRFFFLLIDGDVEAVG